MNQKKKILIFLLIFVAVGSIVAVTLFCTSSDDAAGRIEKGLRAESVKVSQVDVGEDIVSVSYVQHISFKQSELYAVWTYIMATVAKNTTAQKVVIMCNFEDGEVMQVEAQIKDAELFIRGEITDEEFLGRITVKPLTKGPVL